MIIFFPVCKYCKYHKFGKCECFTSAFWEDKTSKGNSCEEFNISKRKAKITKIKEKLKNGVMKNDRRTSNKR